MSISFLDAPEVEESKETELLTVMEPYTFHWKPSFFSWSGREISVLLPQKAKYSRGLIPEASQAGRRIFRQDLVEASTAIPVPSSGKIALSLSCTSREVKGDRETTITQNRMVELSFSLLGKGESKEEHLAKLKQKSIAVLSETDSSIMTKNRAEYPSFFPSIQKTIISGDLLLQIKCDEVLVRVAPANPFYRMIDQIALV